MSPIGFYALLAVEGLLCSLKIRTVYTIWKDKQCSLSTLWKDKIQYGISLICILLIGLLYYTVGKELVVMQFLDLLLSYLLLSVIDIRTHQIPDSFLIYIGLSQIFYRLCVMPLEGLLWELLTGIVVVVLLLILSILTKGSFGMGDAKLLGVTAVFTGASYLIQIIFWGMLCAFVYSIYLLACKKGNKKTELPFVPFLMGGLIVHMLVWVL